MSQSIEPLRTVEFLPNPNASRHRWTQQELQDLRSHYPNGGTKTVGPMLPRRSKATIKVMANKLGIKKFPFSPQL